MIPTDKEIIEFYLWYHETKIEESRFLTVIHKIKAWEEWKAIQEKEEMANISRSIGLSSDDKKDE